MAGLGTGPEPRAGASARGTISLVIGDDQRLFVQAVRTALVQHGFDVSAVAYSLDETLAAVRATQPDVCLVENGRDKTPWSGSVAAIAASCPQVKVVVVSGDGSADAVASAIESGANGYVQKTRDLAALTVTLTRVAGGEIVVDTRPEVRRRQVVDCGDPHRMARHLTARERECLKLLVEGLDTRAIAHRLGVAVTTARSHIQATLTKLGAHSRLEAAAMTVRYDLLGDGSEGGLTQRRSIGSTSSAADVPRPATLEYANAV